MKLLVDENLSQRLALSLNDCFPDSVHVRNVRLLGATDRDIWGYALANGFCILTKDTDFQHRSLLEGGPPKIILVRLGNCTTDRVEIIVRNSLNAIDAFMIDADSALLVIP